MRTAGTGWVVAAAESAWPRAPGARAARARSAAAPGHARNARFLTALRSGFADVLSSMIDGGAAERGDPGRGDVAFKRRDIRCRLRRGRAGLQPRSVRRCRNGSDLHFRIGNGRSRFRPERRASPRWPRSPGLPALPPLFRAQGGHLLGLCRPLVRSRLGRRRRYLARFPELRRRGHLQRLLGHGRIDAQQGQVGSGSSFSRANTGSGGARRDGRLANSSCAARNRAAAPRPNTRIDIESTIAANRKRKPGSMDASSALLDSAGLLMPRERGDHCVADSHGSQRGESGRIESISAPVCFLLQNLRFNAAPRPADGDFRCDEASLPQAHG